MLTFFSPLGNVYWSKDIILLVTDQGNVGTQAWLEAYHGIEQKGKHYWNEDLIKQMK